MQIRQMHNYKTPKVTTKLLYKSNSIYLIFKFVIVEQGSECKILFLLHYTHCIFSFKVCNIELKIDGVVSD